MNDLKLSYEDNSFIIILEKIGSRLARSLFWVSGCAIILMMLLTCADVILRYLRMPIPGTYELVCYLGALTVACAMAHTSVQKGHVTVSILVQLFPRRIQYVIESITGSLGFILFALVSWRSALYAHDLCASGEISLTLELPFYPFIYGVSLSAAAVSLILFVDLLKNLLKVFGK